MSESKLTKKQLKADAFKAAKSGHSNLDDVADDVDNEASTSEGKRKRKKQHTSDKGKGSRLVPDGGDLPEMDLDPDEDEPKKSKKSENKRDKKGKQPDKLAEDEVDEAPSVKAVKSASSKKRKRAPDEEGEGKLSGETLSGKASSTKSKGKGKKLEIDAVSSDTPKGAHLSFGEDGTAVALKPKAVAGKLKTAAGIGEEGKANKYIVFVGNMSFTTTSTDIAKHFEEHCGEKPTVRLLTKKADPSALAGLSASKRKSIAKGKAADPSGPTSKGCAFVEFTTPAALQKALRFHHTTLAGRQINVELTAGGGGKGQERQAKISKKNQALDEERKKIHEKYVKPAAEANKAKAAAKEGAEPATKKPRLGPGEGEAQWGSRAGSSNAPAAASAPSKSKGKWAASGPNAVRLQG